MPQKRLSCAERRAQIIRVAMDLFASRGFKGATTRSIAQAAGVSEAIIFRHFETKEDLYNAIIEHILAQRQDAWEHEEAAIERCGTLEDLLTAYATSFISRHRDDPTFIRLMLYSALEDHKFRQRFFESNRSPWMRAVRKRIQEGVESGEYMEVDPHLTMLSFFWSLLQYSVNRFVASPDAPPVEDDEKFIRNHVRVYVASLTAAPPAEPAPIR